MDKIKLAEILDKHDKWLYEETDGERAHLNCVDLHGANLRGVDLRYVCLSCANLSGVDLRYADLRYAHLSYAHLNGADLRGVDFTDADLRGVDFTDADLSDADLRGADLRGAKIDKRIAEKFYPLCCPEVGDFIGWKKVNGNYIVKLKITEDAKRSSAYGRKCRCSKAEVVAIENIDGTIADIKTVNSNYDKNFFYKIGEIVEPTEPFNEDRFNECASGIHFFITRQEAVDYVL